MTQSRAREQKRLRKKAELLWRLVTTTAGVADLVEPLKRVEQFFERLTKRQRVTVAMIVTQLVKGFNEIDAEIEAESVKDTQVEETNETGQAPQESNAIEPDEVIQPNQDGSTTGD